MIAVTFALPAESSDFISRLDGAVRGAAGPHSISGSLHGAEICVLHTGVGEKFARERVNAFLREQKPRFLLSSGFAGALTERWQVGDVFVSENFSDADLARRCGLPEARLTTISHVIEDVAARQRLAVEEDASVVDMETKWIAEACQTAAIPLLSVRAISDSCAAPLPAPAHVLFDVARQRTPALRLAVYLFGHPEAMPKLLRFAKGIALTRRKLADALEKICAM